MGVARTYKNNLRLRVDRKGATLAKLLVVSRSLMESASEEKAAGTSIVKPCVGSKGVTLSLAVASRS